jgi:hypothetical protein
MGRIQAVLLTLVGGAITVAAIAFMPQTGGIDWLGLGVALFFGACTLVAMSYLIPASIPAAEADGSITIHNSRIRSLIMAVACIAITAASVCMLMRPDPDGDWRWYVFYLLPIPCAVFALVLLRGVFAARPAYRFDREGLTRFQWGRRTVRWADVTGIRAITIRGAKSLVLDLTPDARAAASTMSRLGAATGFGDLTLAPGATGLRPDQLEQLVRQYWKSGVR